MSIRLQKQVGPFWITVPCEGGFGSCDYRDFCSHWPLPGPDCPNAFVQNKIPCSCPIPAGSYNLPYSDLGRFTTSSIPSWLENGMYYVKSWIRDTSGNTYICINMSLRLRGG